MIETGKEEASPFAGLVHGRETGSRSDGGAEHADDPARARDR
jgi:hypothetical protein